MYCKEWFLPHPLDKWPKFVTRFELEDGTRINKIALPPLPRSVEAWSPQPQSALLSLPRELRDKIYAFLFCEAPRIRAYRVWIKSKPANEGTATATVTAIATATIGLNSHHGWLGRNLKKQREQQDNDTRQVPRDKNSLRDVNAPALLSRNDDRIFNSRKDAVRRRKDGHAVWHLDTDNLDAIARTCRQARAESRDQALSDDRLAGTTLEFSPIIFEVDPPSPVAAAAAAATARPDEADVAALTVRIAEADAAAAAAAAAVEAPRKTVPVTEDDIKRIRIDDVILSYIQTVECTVEVLEYLPMGVPLPSLRDIHVVIPRQQGSAKRDPIHDLLDDLLNQTRQHRAGLRSLVGLVDVPDVPPLDLTEAPELLVQWIRERLWNGLYYVHGREVMNNRSEDDLIPWLDVFLAKFADGKWILEGLGAYKSELLPLWPGQGGWSSVHWNAEQQE